MVSKNYYKLAYYNFVKQSHYYIFINNFKLYISQIFKAFNFLSVRFRFAKTLSLRGFEKSEVIHSIYNFFKNWIATPLLRSARNDNYFYSSLRGIGNAEAIKFTFDSLSRKIKNPCLVIKKIYTKRRFLK